VTAATTTAAVAGRSAHRRLPRFLRRREGALGAVLLALVLLVSFAGPFVAPHPLSRPVSFPGAPPSSAVLFGTDSLGRDVLSRVLFGGSSVLTLSLVSIALTYLVGVQLGVLAGLSRRAFVDPLIMRLVDLLITFPPLLLLLVLLSGAGEGFWVLVLGIALVLFPGVARVARSATAEVATTGYVEAATVRGERLPAIMYREVLPNIAPAILADLGVRFAAAVILAASVNFLGLGAQPPAADWGLMVSENRTVLATNVWAVALPALLLAVLTISVNLLADAYAHSLGRSDGRSR